VGATEGVVEGVVEGATVGAVVGDGEGFVVVGACDGALVGCDIKSISQHVTDATFCIPCAFFENPS